MVSSSTWLCILVTCPVYAIVHNSVQSSVTFKKVPEQHGHFYLVGLLHTN